MFKVNRGFVLFCLLFLTMPVFLSGCGDPKVDKFVNINSNETVFVVPVEGQAKNGQAQFNSVEYLNSKKIPAKRIYLPQRKVSTGRWWWQYKWVPTDLVITVNRSPVHLVWEGPTGIKVESRDSIAFTIGIDITAQVTEDNTALFLYNYSSGDINQAISGAVRSKAIEICSAAFAAHNLDAIPAVYDKNGKLVTAEIPGARDSKGAIITEAKKKLSDYFIKQGITINAFGLTGGLKYDDKEIQTAINQNFESALDIENKKNQKIAQDQENERILSIADTAKTSADTFAKAKDAQIAQVHLEIEKMRAQAFLKIAENWKGQLPANMMPEKSNFLFGMGTDAIQK